MMYVWRGDGTGGGGGGGGDSRGGGRRDGKGLGDQGWRGVREVAVQPLGSGRSQEGGTGGVGQACHPLYCFG